MAASFRRLAGGLLVAGFMLGVATIVPAQDTSKGTSSWATLESPPTGVLPPGDVLRPGHLGREIGNLNDIIHFYSDLIGLGLVGARDAPRPFISNRRLAEFAELGEDDDAYKSVSRVALMPIPGTAAAPGAPEMTIEAIEIKGIRSRTYNPPLSDPGASYLKLFVTDIDRLLAVLKSERVPVITEGGNPVELASWPGIEGRIRTVFVRDPDGYPVQLIQLATPPATTTAAPNARVLGARVTIVVDNIEATARMYQSLVGPDLKFWASPAPMGDKTYESLVNTRGQFRFAMAVVPGSPVVLELVEYVKHNKRFKRGFIQDPGTAHLLFMSKDVDVMIDRVHKAKLHTLSRSNAPVFIGPTVRAFFVPDPQGFWLEFMDRDVKRDPSLSPVK